MRILDAYNGRKLDKITLHLRKNEAKDLMDSLANMLSRSDSGHEHISNRDCQKDITICIDDDPILEDSKNVP